MHRKHSVYVVFVFFIVCKAESNNENQKRRLDDLEKVVKLIQQQNQRLEKTVQLQQTEIRELRIQLSMINDEHNNDYKIVSRSDLNNMIKETVLKVSLENGLLNSNDSETGSLDYKQQFLTRKPETEIELHDDDISNKLGIARQYIRGRVGRDVTSGKIHLRRAIYTPNQNVAFYAYLSHDENAPSVHHPMVFDTVMTNIQGAYNRFDGMFNVPVSGVYVFTYSMRFGCHAVASMEIVKNADVMGVIHIDSDETCDHEQVSSTVVISASTGDVVFIRTHSTLQIQGGIVSNTHGRSSFAGWLLSNDSAK
ncbi:uncharacterized protein [Mytilus edulis]|uniref:uncharacterized protein n=1 Tax=Mytilus edulis TaxID=6550 RepID=UPI0039F0B84B